MFFSDSKLWFENKHGLASLLPENQLVIANLSLQLTFSIRLPSDLQNFQTFFPSDAFCCWSSNGDGFDSRLVGSTGVPCLQLNLALRA